MHKKLAFCIAILFHVFCVGLSSAQGTTNVAIMPFSGDNTVSPDQLEFISSKFSGELIATNAFKVLDRGKMDFILQEQGFQQSGACNSSECKVQMGQLLGVDNLVAAKLVRFGGTYALHLEFIDVGTGEISKTVDVEEKGELEDVYKSLCSNAAQSLRISLQDNGSLNLNQVSSDAIPKMKSKPFSIKQKVALGLWSISLVGAGVGVYSNLKGDQYSEDYDDAIKAEDSHDTKVAYDNTHSAETARNTSYGVSIGSAVIGAILWFWPEGK